MKIFSCTNCQSVVFFENTTCLSCGAGLGFIPGSRTLVAITPLPDDTNKFQVVKAAYKGVYRKCLNFSAENACNWMVPDEDANPHCVSCRLSRTIPDLTDAALRHHWLMLEAAKRRLCYGLAALNLPLQSKVENPEHGVAFDFLVSTPEKTVSTGHDEGVITIDCAEADDVSREQVKANLHENYRTLLGHFRHEIGHFYWDRLVRDSDNLVSFRTLFGTEEDDYAKAQETYYKNGPPADWRTRFISAYASMHPWEDWAETWAHYLHMADVVEIGAQFGISLASTPLTRDGDTHRVRLHEVEPDAFDQLINAWVPLTYAVNSLNRAMGLNDWYPFTPSPQAIEKLRYVHRIILAAGSTESAMKSGTVVSAIPALKASA